MIEHINNLSEGTIVAAALVFVLLIAATLNLRIEVKYKDVHLKVEKIQTAKTNNETSQNNSALTGNVSPLTIANSIQALHHLLIAIASYIVAWVIIILSAISSQAFTEQSTDIILTVMLIFAGMLYAFVIKSMRSYRKYLNKIADVGA